MTIRSDRSAADVCAAVAARSSSPRRSRAPYPVEGCGEHVVRPVVPPRFRERRKVPQAAALVVGHRFPVIRTEDEVPGGRPAVRVVILLAGLHPRLPLRRRPPHGATSRTGSLRAGRRQTCRRLGNRAGIDNGYRPRLPSTTLRTPAGRPTATMPVTQSTSSKWAHFSSVSGDHRVRGLPLRAGR
jgi:hypothetical protein